MNSKRDGYEYIMMWEVVSKDLVTWPLVRYLLDKVSYIADTVQSDFKV